MHANYLYAPIVRINPQLREVTVRATSEREDAFHTRFLFEASRDAFERWAGNVREMHQPVAVGCAARILPYPAERAIDVVLRVSKGAEQTWQKILDGTLKGASIGAANVQWQRDKSGISTAIKYDLVELSLVDNPANPDCQIYVIRGGTLVAESAMQNGSESAPSQKQTKTSMKRTGAIASDEKNTSSTGSAADTENAQFGVPPAVKISPDAEDSEDDDAVEEDDDDNDDIDEDSDNSNSNKAPTAKDDTENVTKSGKPTRLVGQKKRASGSDIPSQQLAKRHATAKHAQSLTILADATRILGQCGCSICRNLAEDIQLAADLPETRRGIFAIENTLREYIHQVADGLAQTLEKLAERVEQIAAEPMPGAPAASETRAFQALSADEKMRRLQDTAARSQDPAAQMEAAAAILQLQQSQNH